MKCHVSFAGTGNITEDMEKQLQANHIRISVLEQENTKLRAALAKVKAAAQQGVLQVSWGAWRDGAHCAPQGHPANPVPQPLGIGSLAIPLQDKDSQERKAVVLLVQHCLWLLVGLSRTKPSSLVLWCLSEIGLVEPAAVSCFAEVPGAGSQIPYISPHGCCASVSPLPAQQ